MKEAYCLDLNTLAHRVMLALAGVLLTACVAQPGTESNSSGIKSSSVASKSSSSSNVSSANGVGSSSSRSVVSSEKLSRPGLAARISKFEYQHSVLDVLGVELLPAELDQTVGGIPDDTGDGVFKHLADNQVSVEQHVLAYFQVAEAVAQRANIDQLLQQNSVCNKATLTCGQQFVKALGRRLFRRPLSDIELNTMLGVYQDALDEQSNYKEAAQWTLIALLQSPQFLFKMDNELAGTPNQPRNLDAYELAAKLAAFLWVSVPDETLLKAAADQSLLKEPGLSAQVNRMLADPKARRFTKVFAIDFSRARFASFEGATDADRKALNESIIATFQDHFWTQGKGIADLFTTTRFIVNPVVADLLGISIMGTELQPVDVSALPERVGLMSHPAMIAGMGDREVGSFVNRGKYLMERLLCQHPIDVPAALAGLIDQFSADTTGFNEHERAAVRMTRRECWGCHKQFEPLSFGFSRFDGAGRYIGERDSQDRALPLDGWVPTFEAVEPVYTDVASYMQILATNSVIQTCMTEHFLDFATSRIGDSVGKKEAEHVGYEYISGGSTLTSMVDAVVRSTLFQTIVPSPRGIQQ
ncbi:MAG: DUF1592 domain-containing protein [Marinagarivorans sp.]|nr:DUF1592 domain-containing protein [Marinagarivorans sp.]